MREFERKRKIRRVLYSKFTIFILLAFIFLIGKAVWSAYNRVENSGESSDIAREELEKLKERELYLEDQIESLKTEAGVDALIRDKFKAVKEGEEMSVIIEDKGENSTTSTNK